MEYTYTISSDFSNGVAPDRFAAEIEAVLAAKPTIISVQPETDDCVVVFEDEVDKPTLDAIVSAHSGQKIPSVIFQASSLLVGKETEVTETDTWEDLGGVVTNPLFFIPDVAHILARVVGQIAVQGTGAKFRIVKEDNTPISDEYDAPDTSGAWTAFVFHSHQPPDVGAGEQLFRLQAKLGAATSAKARYTSMTLLEIK